MKTVCQIAEQVLKNLKRDIKSSTDIIPRTELPYVLVHQFPSYIEKYGEETFSQYRAHVKKTQDVRAKAMSLLPIYRSKGIPAPISTIQVAITLCGVGECGETTNRAAVDLVAKFLEEGLNTPVNTILTRGKVCKPYFKNTTDSYDHAFVIIGQLPIDWDFSIGLSAFRSLGSDCILVDPSLGIIGLARDAEKILKKIFDVYEINRIESCSVISPQIDGSIVKEILRNSNVIAGIIKHDLHLEEGVSVLTSPVLTPVSSTVTMPTLQRKILFDIRQSFTASRCFDSVECVMGAEEKLLPMHSLFRTKPSLFSACSLVKSSGRSFSCPDVEDNLLPTFSIFKPKPILLSVEPSCDWDKIERLVV